MRSHRLGIAIRDISLIDPFQRPALPFQVPGAVALLIDELASRARFTNLLLVLAHPDDAEIWCGGTILKYARAGAKVDIIVMVSDEPHRIEEAIEALRLIHNVTVRFMDGESCVDFSTRQNATSLFELINSGQYGAVITHAPDDIHIDHRRCFELLQLSLFHGRFDTETPRIYVCNSYSGKTGDGRLFEPTNLVDVSEFAEQKQALIAAHKSQRFQYYIDMVDKMDRFYGAMAGVDRAECFKRLMLHKSSSGPGVL